ncbi:hypothetical protein JDV02_008198 [Purpureocillium takamizusanense]|uniref:Uncharacterized protein n=1 Tax=Purpureocillium takamizusanense TaxID=2060973 RepID=A0A9Q8QM94_9HYPO|nr:uncharacterized protein JDV02_008198 [Purpureocillium takamizusanense]UNI22298.1 hypothetical protein JDV02_008198 [Purpureocillium takamizusanense]
MSSKTAGRRRRSIPRRRGTVTPRVKTSTPSPEAAAAAFSGQALRALADDAAHEINGDKGLPGAGAVASAGPQAAQHGAGANTTAAAAWWTMCCLRRPEPVRRRLVLLGPALPSPRCAVSTMGGSHRRARA